MDNHIVIMAGGIGSRFWPMSTPECPKQFIDVMGCGRTLIQLTADRFDGVCPRENVWVVTSEKYIDIVREQLPEIPESNILAEPCARNTAPCIANACWKIKKKHPNANVVVTPSDALVIDTGEFRRVVEKALRFTDNSSAIVTLGIKPTRPETGYGYIAAGDQIMTDKEIFTVDAFKEKPDRETADRYLAEGNYFWNAGIFVWNVRTITSVMRVYAPGIAQIFDRIFPDFYTEKENETIKKLFPTCEAISIDYAVMEKAQEIYVLPASFGWSDLGTWGALRGLLPQDKSGNATVGADVRLYESKNCIVHTSEEKRVVIQGLDGYIIAEKDNTLLICKLDEEQRIKEFSK
ncbi:mannose-1-phosphate guanylyltransferase [Bacteroides thetaiotaomicron]|uniref:mannose-1-phosphate guanylyltransferase n=1 Tax=Bacteroides thetaiotaomicron TaxID=818 RepID=UPI0039C0B676